MEKHGQSKVKICCLFFFPNYEHLKFSIQAYRARNTRLRPGCFYHNDEMSHDSTI